MNISQNLSIVKEKIKKAAEKSSRKAEDITIIAVTKTVGCDEAKEILSLGINNLAENRALALKEKMEALGGASWHLIGHLQTNKLKYVVGKVKLIHSVDSLHLLKAISEMAKKRNIVQDILLEVNISGEESKYGLTKDELLYIINRLEEFDGVSCKGIMTMAPKEASESEIRQIFKEAKELAYKNGLSEVSMGMSGDYEIAVEEGATYVRLGNAIFN